ncbi:hypothetical protein TCAL_16275 [Tigriopus californicus]|uniref:Ubiquitin-like domain-containing protein n=1 Tax=Tigriopus californicus TaxID=6832 RepID=A0A553N760_TIGCA|nr:hypothetical protein TCAL_16275 [Tigriopus californicus]
MTDKETNSEQTKPATATSTTKMSQPVSGAASSPPNSSTTTPPSYPLPNLGVLTNPDLIAVTIAPFTGGPFTMAVNRNDTIEELKKTVAKKLKVLKDRICLLYRERQLSEGTLADNALVEGSRITLLPRAETGLLAQKPEQSVMQALESLSDSQVQSDNNN